MECSSMVSIAAFVPGDPGSNPGWFAVSNEFKSKIEFSLIMQACSTIET